VDGEETVVVSAGDRVVTLTGSGDVRWDVEIPVMSAGRPACDGERVYAGAGDGQAYAFDARTGARLWSFSTNTRTTAYTRLIYGPWDDVVELLPGGGVLVSTVSGAWAPGRRQRAAALDAPRQLHLRPERDGRRDQDAAGRRARCRCARRRRHRGTGVDHPDGSAGPQRGPGAGRGTHPGVRRAPAACS